MILKHQIHTAFLEVLEKKIADIQSELDAIKESATAETKSSMGDKYETSREMMMQERSRLGSQLEVFINQKAALNAIDLEKNYTEVSYGCLVKTVQATFYLSAAIGPITLEKQSIFAISGEAPLSKVMIGKRAGESFSFNNKTFEIKSIE